MSYSSEDKFLNSYSTDSLRVNDSFCYDDSLFIVKSYPDESFYKFYIFNRKSLQPVNGYWPNVKSRSEHYGWDYHVRYNEKMLFHEKKNTSIFELTPDSAILRYTFDVDGRTPPEGFWERTDLDVYQFDDEYEEKGYIGHILFFSETDTHLLVYYEGGTRKLSGYAWIDKKTGAYQLFDKIIFDDDFKWRPHKMYALSDGQIIIPIPADVILEASESQFRKRFPNLKEDDNPVLCVVTMK